MGSEQNDVTSITTSGAQPCANGCGFFGTAANMNLCSKCYRDLRVKQEQAASAKATMEESMNIESPKQSDQAQEFADKDSNMGSGQNDGTSFTPSEPKPCANGCGFFGTAANMNLCSKCYRDLRVKEEQAAPAKTAMGKSMHIKSPKQRDQAPELESPPWIAASSSQQLVVGSSSDQLAERPKIANRCLSCNKKVGLTGFQCKCGSTFCGVDRYPEKHDCTFDFKSSGRDAIVKANPVVKADKLDRI